MRESSDKQLLATVIHISDLHFGDKFTTDETKFKRLLASLPYLQGTCAHSYQAARALAIRVNQIIENRINRNIPVCVAFTGDLTSSGEDAEFTVGSTYLRSEYRVGAGQSVGLGLGNDREFIEPGDEAAVFTVPGNHDIWKRRHPDVMGTYRRHFPNRFPRFFIDTAKRSIILYPLDSTQNTVLRHRLARGRVPEEDLDALVAMLKFGTSLDCIQIVCLHHPIGDPPDKTFGVSMILDAREQIAQRLAESGASLVLSGHVHECYIVDAKPSIIPAHVVAGTATQQFSERSFFVLDIYEDEIWPLVFGYDQESLQFVPIANGMKGLSVPPPSHQTVSSAVAADGNARERFKIRWG